MKPNKSPWYEEYQGVEVPAFLQEIKELLNKQNDLLNKQKIIFKRSKNASILLDKERKKDQEFLLEAANILESLSQEFIDLQKEIFNIDKQILLILESKMVKFGLSIKTNKEEDELGNIVESRKITFVTNEDLLNSEEEKITVTPERLLFFKTIKEVFNFNLKEIEFLTKDKFREDDIY